MLAREVLTTLPVARSKVLATEDQGDLLSLVEARSVDQEDISPRRGRGAKVVVEPDAAIEAEHGFRGVESVAGEDLSGAREPVQMPQPEALAPLSFATIRREG